MRWANRPTFQQVITFRSNRTADDRLQGYQLWDVYVMNTDGTGVTMVASEPAGNAMDASWQPIPVPHRAGAATRPGCGP